ncbi:zinc finger protein ZAT9-like protein [Tanacetum coccineum]
MYQDQEPKLHFCKYCKQGFSNGKQLGGHMRSHSALIAASRKKGVHGVNHKKSQHVDQGYDHDYGANGRIKGRDFVNGGKGIGFVYDYEKMVKKSQHFDQDYDQVYGDFDDGGGYEMVKKSHGANNAYGLRENPKRSWRVSSLNCWDLII